MSDWKAGDKAYCIYSFMCNINRHPSGKPVEGSIYLVTGVIEDKGEYGLQIAGLPSIASDEFDWGWWSVRFRKVVPRSERKVECVAASKPVINMQWLYENMKLLS